MYNTADLEMRSTSPSLLWLEPFENMEFPGTSWYAPFLTFYIVSNYVRTSKHFQ